MKIRTLLCSALLVTSGLGFACGDDKEEEEESSGIECDSTLTYDKDIAPIISSKCATCHSAKLTPAQRVGAPSDHNFDNEADVRKNLDHVEEEAVIEKAMPPTGALPEAERQKLGAWIACQ